MSQRAAPAAALLLLVTLLVLITLPARASGNTARRRRRPRSRPRFVCPEICRRWYRPARRDCRRRWIFNRGCRILRCRHVRVRRVRRRNGRVVRRRIVRRGWVCGEVRPIAVSPTPLPSSPPFKPSPNPILPPPSPPPRLQDTVLAVTYLWDGGRTDLDTAVMYFGEKTGWECKNEFDATFVTFAGDDNTADGSEQHFVDLGKAREAGRWTTSTSIDLFAGWHDGLSSGGARVEVYLQFKKNQNIVPGTEKSTTIAPGQQPACATKKVATVTVTRNAGGSVLDLKLTPV